MPDEFTIIEVDHPDSASNEQVEVKEAENGGRRRAIRNKTDVNFTQSTDEKWIELQ